MNNKRISRGRRWLCTGIVLGSAAFLALACAAPPAAPSATAKPAAEAAKPAADPAALAADKNVMLYAIPNSPPRATPTPPPAGFVPPTAVPLPQPEKLDVHMYVDTVTSGNGESKEGLNASRTCLITGVIKRGMHLVFRMKGVEVASGTELTPENVASAVVKIPGQPDRTMRYARHGQSVHWGGAAWDVPMDYPLGPVNFTVEVATKGGKTGVFKPMALSATTVGLTVVD